LGGLQPGEGEKAKWKACNRLRKNRLPGKSWALKKKASDRARGRTLPRKSGRSKGTRVGRRKNQTSELAAKRNDKRGGYRSERRHLLPEG